MKKNLISEDRARLCHSLHKTPGRLLSILLSLRLLHRRVNLTFQEAPDFDVNRAEKAWAPGTAQKGAHGRIKPGISLLACLAHQVAHTHDLPVEHSCENG